jgi:RNA polymerase sigma-70 factor, ECF subfamily
VDEDIFVELLADSQPVPEVDIITREQIAILWRLLGTLPEDTREMLVLRYILGWQVKQIASHLDRNENNVSVTIRRALKSLQRDWPQEKDHE